MVEQNIYIIYIYIVYYYIYVYIYQQGHVATLHIKLPHQFAGSGRGKVAFKPDRRMGKHGRHIIFTAILGWYTAAVKGTEQVRLIQLMSWSKSFPNWGSHVCKQKVMTMANQCQLESSPLLPYTDWWSSTLHGLGVRPSSGEVRLEVGLTHQPTKPLTISRWWFQTCCMFNFY